MVFHRDSMTSFVLIESDAQLKERSGTRKLSKTVTNGKEQIAMVRTKEYIICI